MLEKTLESPLDNEEIKLVNPKGDQPWVFIGKTDAEADAPNFGHLMKWKRLWYSERLRVAGEGGGWGWDGWMASLTQWTWVWVNSGSWWWTGRPGVLQFMGSQRVGHDWATELNWLNDLLGLVLEYKEQRIKKETGLHLSAGPTMLSFYLSTKRKNKIGNLSCMQ